MAIWVAIKVNRSYKGKKGCLFWKYGEITLEKNLFHEWEDEKEKEEKAATTSSTLKANALKTCSRPKWKSKNHKTSATKKEEESF